MNSNFSNYQTNQFYDELIGISHLPHKGIEMVYDYFNDLSIDELKSRQKNLETAMINMGITFNVYSEEGGTERIIPIDIIPRIIKAKEWTRLEKGLKQRIFALNEFLKDIYSEQKILKDKIIPSDVIFSSKGFIKECTMKGVRGNLDRRHITWDVNWVPLRRSPQFGDFELTKFIVEDFLITVQNPSFRPYSISIFHATLPILRKQWLLYDFFCADSIVGVFDDCLFFKAGGSSKIISWLQPPAGIMG